MAVYLDIAFLINFLFDAEILFLTLVLLSKRITYRRIVFAAFLGGLQGVFVFFPYFRILSLPPVSFLTPLLMVIIATKPVSVREIFEGYMFFLTSAFLVGGAMAFLKLKIIFALLLILPLYLAILNIRKNIFKKHTSVTLFYKGKKIEKQAVYDSGNMVFYCGKPVIFGSKKIFFELTDRNFADSNILSEINADDLCMVCYKTVGKSGIAAGIRLENAVVSGKSFDGAVICMFDGGLKDEIILNGIMA